MITLKNRISKHFLLCIFSIFVLFVYAIYSFLNIKTKIYSDDKVFYIYSKKLYFSDSFLNKNYFLGVNKIEVVDKYNNKHSFVFKKECCFVANAIFSIEKNNHVFNLFDEQSSSSNVISINLTKSSPYIEIFEYEDNNIVRVYAQP